VEVFREVRRVLADDGTLWLVLGDCYITKPMGWGSTHDPKYPNGRNRRGAAPSGNRTNDPASLGYKHKDLAGIPWRLAFALRADGWWLRSDTIWSKPNAMPESARDRPSKAHDYLFLLAKAERYYYDADSIREVQKTLGERHEGRSGYRHEHPSKRGGFAKMERKLHPKGANRRSVWTIPTQPFPEAHFATFPEALVEPCILAGSAERDAVLDPFAGSGTVAVVAHRLRRRSVGIELSPAYLEIAQRRIGAAKRQGRLFEPREAPAEQLPLEGA
jgi:DNA modification methylase